jgi:hypothetical protein
MKNAVTRHHHALARDVVELAELATILSRRRDAEPESERFSELLVETVSRENGDDRIVAAAAVEQLRMHDEDDAADFLIEELEIESTYQVLPEPGTRLERMALMFAIPVTFPSFGEPNVHLTVDESFEQLHDILYDAEVVSARCGFRLLPRLFTVEELRSRTYHELRSMTISMAEQVLADPRGPVSINECNIDFKMPGDFTLTSQYPFAQLRFVVGIAVTSREGIEDLFPPLEEDGNDYDERYGSPMDDDDDESAPGGYDDEGVYWSDAFAEALSACAHSVAPALDVAAPDGLHADLRIGLTMLRAQNTRLQMEHALRDAEMVPEDICISESPLTENGVEVTGVQLELLPVDGRSEPIATVEWQMLPHEQLDEAVDNLYQMMGALGLAPAEDVIESACMPVSRLIH